MSKWTRRELLKSGLAVSASAATGKDAVHLAGIIGSPSMDDSLGQQPELPASSPRERGLLDFGWRFHLGHASDPSRDFGFGSLAEELVFAKSGGMPDVTRAKFDDSAWQAIDLPHD